MILLTILGTLLALTLICISTWKFMDWYNRRLDKKYKK